MLRRLLAAIAALAIAAPALAAASFDHFTGTSAPAGFTFVASGNGVGCMNGANVAGSGGTCSGAVTGESFLNFVTAANADAALAYRTTAVPLNESRLFRFSYRNATTGTSYLWLNEGVPVAGTNTNVFGSSGKALLRIAAQNSGANIGIDRYDNARTRTQWNTAGSAWAAPTVNATTTLTGTYQEILLEIDGPNRRWRVAVVGQTGTSNTPSASLYMAALSDWVLFSFHEGAGSYCNPSCGSVYLTVGEPLTDAATGTAYFEFLSEHDGTAIDAWLNGRNAGGTWSIYHYTALPDASGVPSQWMPEDRTTTAVAVGGGGAWDEQQAKDPYVLQDGATYVMMYGGSNAAGKFQAGCASASSVTGPWTKCPNNPISALSAATNRDQVANPVLVRDDAEPDAAKRYKMFTVGVDTSSPLRFRVYEQHCSALPTAAACDTAAEWSAAALIWDVGAGSSIDEIGAGRGLPMQLSGVPYLFAGVRALSGGASQNRQETYATSSDRWLSAVTKSGTITNPSASSDCNTTTTAAITTTGSRTFTVASTTGCVPDMMVVVDDDGTSGNYHVNRICNVVNSTTLTMCHNEDALASGARVRGPNAFWQVDTGPVFAIPTGFAKFATCFDPMVGGGSTFDAYAEQPCTWTSSSPLGPWTLYGLGSPVAPLNAFGRGASNENPSLINGPLRAAPSFMGPR